MFEKCNHVNGSCPNGCVAGMMGDKCDTGQYSTFSIADEDIRLLGYAYCPILLTLFKKDIFKLQYIAYIAYKFTNLTYIRQLSKSRLNAYKKLIKGKQIILVRSQKLSYFQRQLKQFYKYSKHRKEVGRASCDNCLMQNALKHF